jgi:hypothetical protein
MLDDRIDVKLYQTNKLDFKQMKRIMIRMHRIDDALIGLERISFYLKHYEDACKHKSLPKYVGLSELLRIYSIEEFSKSLRTEANRLGNQIERCNLYYQSQLNTKTARVAYVALVISALSVLLAITGLLFGVN